MDTQGLFRTESAALVVSSGSFVPENLVLAISEPARIESRHDLLLMHREDIDQSQLFRL